MDHLAKLRAAQQPASGPAAAKPSSVAVATDVGATSSDSSNTVVSTVQHSSHPRVSYILAGCYVYVHLHWPMTGACSFLAYGLVM